MRLHFGCLEKLSSLSTVRLLYRGAPEAEEIIATLNVFFLRAPLGFSFARAALRLEAERQAPEEALRACQRKALFPRLFLS